MAIVAEIETQNFSAERTRMSLPRLGAHRSVPTRL